MSARPRQPPAYWYDGGVPPWHTRLLSGLYAAAVNLRAGLYRRGVLRSVHPDRPVLVVGNLIAGGSGKTPLTIAIVERLREAGWRPGVASRGYGRDQSSVARWVEAGTGPDLGGDEPVLIARRTGVPVRVDADRVAAAKALIAHGCNVVVCDDGLQHLRLARDLEIEVIDGRRRYGNGRLLPAGPLREPVERSAHCDFRVTNLGVDHAIGPGVSGSGVSELDVSGPGAPEPSASEPGAFEPGAVNSRDAVPAETRFGEWPMRLRHADAQALRGGRSLPLHAFVGQRVHAVAGIGDPERFFSMLRALGIAVVPHAFADHHRYRADDLDLGSDLPVLMTEKDAVKCAEFATDACWSVPIRAELPEAFWVALLDRLRACAEKERR